MKLEQLVIHTTDTPYGRIVTPDDITIWHQGPLLSEDGRTAIFQGKTISSTMLPLQSLKLVSGKIVNCKKISGRGWAKVGYSDMINIDGTLTNLVEYTFDDVLDSFEITNGASGYNSNSRHVVLVGGWSKDGNKTGKKFNGELYQPEELYNEKMLSELVSYINMQKSIVSSLKVVGHNELTDKKNCPNFNVQSFLKKHNLI